MINFFSPQITFPGFHKEYQSSFSIANVILRIKIYLNQKIQKLNINSSPNFPDYDRKCKEASEEKIKFCRSKHSMNYWVRTRWLLSHQTMQRASIDQPAFLTLQMITFANKTSINSLSNCRIIRVFMFFVQERRIKAIEISKFTTNCNCTHVLL